MNELDSLNKAKEHENNGDFFSAAHFYKIALEEFLKKGDSENIKLCKNKIVEMNKKSISSGKDFKSLNVEHKFTKEQQEQLDRFIENATKDKTLQQALQEIGGRRSFMPIIKEVRESAKRTIPVSYSIMSISAISDEGHLLKGGDNGEIHWLMKMYDIQQQTILQLYLVPVIQKLISNKGDDEFNLKNLLDYFKKGGLINEKSLKFIEKGLKAFFDKDYTTALHILIPRFESVFLNTSELLGIDIISLDQDLGLSTRRKALSDRHLSSEQFINAWGEDFCFQIRFVLLDPLGYKFRHKLAHGDISEEECNFNSCLLVIYLFLVILGRVKKTN
ncbi:DUF4209 domain-containing protein [Candidatus Parcubacteria bacterium]|nr:MAG: DUF4209 domain-containing protein [Candidatus Parcubacteria bacterium]